MDKNTNKRFCSKVKGCITLPSKQTRCQLQQGMPTYPFLYRQPSPMRIWKLRSPQPQAEIRRSLKPAPSRLCFQRISETHRSVQPNWFSPTRIGKTNLNLGSVFRVQAKSKRYQNMHLQDTLTPQEAITCYFRTEINSTSRG